MSISRPTEIFTRRRRYGLLMLAVGLALLTLHDWAVSSLGNADEVGLVIGTLCPLCLVVGAYLIVADRDGRSSSRGG